MRAALFAAVVLTGCRTAAPPEPDPPPEPAVAAVAQPAPTGSNPRRPPDLAGARIVETKSTPRFFDDVAASAPAPAAEAPPPAARAFVFEDSKPWPRPARGTLSTGSYPPTEKEAPFHDRAFGEKRRRREGGVMSMPREVGVYVAWMGVVRGIRVDEAKQETRLLLENKYFDGLTDGHILCVSFAGGGDFVAVLPGVDHPVKPLALVRAYGVVASVKDDVPRVEVDYLRHFDQGRYCFMFVTGDVQGNQEWRKLCRVADDDIYDPWPSPDYYVERLGRRRDFAPGEVEVPKD